MIKRYNFHKFKYGNELLIDFIPLHALEKYICDAGPHILSYYDITLITKGEGRFLLDDNIFEVAPGNVFFSSPWQVRQWELETIPEGMVLIFEEQFLNIFLNDADFIPTLTYFNADTPFLKLNAENMTYVTSVMKSISDEMANFRRNDTQLLKALLLQILIWLNRNFSNQHPEKGCLAINRYMSTFSNLVKEYFERYHNTCFYASQLNITSGHLNDLCKKQFGVSAKRFITNKIMSEAKKMILFSDAPVSEIADRLNYPDASYFIRSFRKYTGMTPLEFRKQNP